MNKRTTTLAAASLLLALTASGCSTKADKGSGGGTGGSGDLKTEVGVTDKEIHLAVQTDSSGVFKILGLGLTYGNEMWAKDVNADGGICGRKIVLDVQDNGYKVDNAIPMYDTQKANNVGFVQLIGSPILAALKTKVVADKVTVLTSSWASSNLDAPEVLMLGQTYDIEVINGMAWAQKQGMIADGDKIGHIYVDSEYGQNGYLGSQAYAKDHNMQIIGVPVSATDTDMTATMTKLKSEGVKAIVVTTTPAAMSSIALQNVNQGMNLPLVGSNPVFSPTMLSDAAVTDALSHLYLVNSVGVFNMQGNDLAKKIAEEYKKEYTDAPTLFVNGGYLGGMTWEAILKQACSDGDMTRQGILDAKKKVTSIDTKGLSGNLDLSKEGQPTTREAFIHQVDASAEGGLKTVQELFESDEAKKYKAPAQK